MSDAKTYNVPDMHCGHCKAAVTEELGALEAVDRVEVDLDTKMVSVWGNDLEDRALRAAITEAGYEAQEIVA